MHSRSARNYVFAVVLTGLLMLAGLSIISQPAFSAPGPALQTAAPVLNGFGDNGAGPVIDLIGVATTSVYIRATDRTVPEDPGHGEFTVYRTAPFGTTLTVNYAVDGTATPGVDYVALSGVVHFAAGSATATIIVTPIDDREPEDDETVIVTLQPGIGYAVGSPSSATVTIIDDDRVGPPPTPRPAPQIRISSNSVGNPWLYLWDQPSGRLYAGPNTTGHPIVFFNLSGGQGRIHRGANATGEILFTVDFGTGRIWAGPNPTGPLVYTLECVPSGRSLQIRVHERNEKGPIIYTISDDDIHEGPNIVGPLVYHGSAPFWGPIQFLLPLLADHRIP